MNKLPDVSIIIVSYNVANLLEECLQSIFERAADELSVEVIVVDNASHDGSVALVRENFPQVRLIENAHNYGFPRGCNQGWRAAHGRYLFFLNPDAKLETNALAELVAFMERQPKAGIAGPQLRYPDGSRQSNCRRFPGRGLAFVESTILQRYSPFKNLSALRRFYCEDLPLDQPQQVDWLVGAAFMVRREVTDQIGGLDERFFMYSEELDFCRRAGAKGWECWYIPTALVTHQEGRSSAQDVPQRHISFQTSKVSYYRKYYGWLFAQILRLFLLGTYIFQYLEEGTKLLLRHKSALRRDRLAMIRQVLASRLRPYRSPYPRLASELEICFISAEYPPQPGGVGDYTARLAQEVQSSKFKVQSFEVPGVSGVRVLTGPASFVGGGCALDLSASTENRGQSQLLQELGNGESRGQSQLLQNQDVAVFRLGSDKWNWACLGQIGRHLQERGADAVVIQYQTGAYRMHPAINFLPLYLRWRLGAACPKVISTFHDLLVPYLFPKAGPVRRWVNQLLLRSSDRVIVTNFEDYGKALEWGAKPEKLNLIPIGSNISPTEFPAAKTKAEVRAEMRQSWNVAETDFVIGYFGLLNRSKGVDVLLEALAELRAASQSQSYRLVIIGGETGQSDPTNRAYARELDQLIARHKLENAIIRTGHLSPIDISRTFATLDTVALPFRDGASFRRGSLLAPLAHALPVVTTSSKFQVPSSKLNLVDNATIQVQSSRFKVQEDKFKTQNSKLKTQNSPGSRLVTDYANIAGVPQLLHCQNVYLVEPENPHALAEALARLRGEPELRATLAQGALELSQHFSWEAIAANLLKILL